MIEWVGIVTRLFAIMNPKGYMADDVNKTKKEFGGLPRILEQLYLQLGCSYELLCMQDTLILPSKHPLFLNYDYLVFFNENQSVCQAGINLRDIGLDDPPVYVGYDNAKWIKISDTLSSFLIAMFGFQASLCLQYSSTEFYLITENDVMFIKQHFAKQPDSLQNWLNFKVDLYANSPDERLALMNTGNDLQMIYAANNQKSFDSMRSILEGTGEPM